MSVREITSQVIREYRKGRLEVPDEEYGSLAEISFPGPVLLLAGDECRAIQRVSLSFSYTVTWRRIAARPFLYQSVPSNSPLAGGVVSEPLDLFGSETRIAIGWTNRPKS